MHWFHVPDKGGTEKETLGLPGESFWKAEAALDRGLREWEFVCWLTRSIGFKRQKEHMCSTEAKKASYCRLSTDSMF